MRGGVERERVREREGERKGVRGSEGETNRERVEVEGRGGLKIIIHLEKIR